MSENAVKQRIKDLLLYKKSNPTKLSKEYSVNQKTLNNQINSDIQLTTSTILLILDAFKDVSAEWLFRGTGEMILHEHSQQTSTPQKYDAEIEIGEDGNLKIRIKK